MLGRGLLAKERALERSVVAGDHREAVEAQDVAALDAPRSDGIVGAIGVDARLEPRPGIHQLGVREGPRDLAHHGAGRVQRHFVLRHAHRDRLDACRPAHVGDARPLLDQGDFLLRFHHAHAHRGLRDVDKLRARQRGLQFLHVLQVDVVKLDADRAAVLDELLHGAEVVVAPPIGVDKIVAEGPPPGLAGVDVGGDRGGALLADDEAVGPPERAEEEITVVVDVVIGGEEHVVDTALGHVLAQLGEARLHLLLGEGALNLLAVTDADQVLKFRCLRHGFHPGIVVLRHCSRERRVSSGFKATLFDHLAPLGTAGRGLHILQEADRVEDRRMDVAGRHRIADAPQRESAGGVGFDGLRRAVHERLVIHLAEVFR